MSTSYASYTRSDSERWNYNTHYYRLFDELRDRQFHSALDVGCGEGMLTRRMREFIPRVVGIDPDETSIAAARDQCCDVEYRCVDVLEDDLRGETFDAVASVAALHHMPAARGLRRLAGLVRPGGTLVVVGCAASNRWWEKPVDAVSFAGGAVMAATHPLWDHAAPTVWPPPVTYTQMRRLARTMLPGARFRRHLLFRYSIVWDRPLDG
ncbi:class I SAM-dependent methyltransferase [Williamsia sp. SKLECPSW1]